MCVKYLPGLSAPMSQSQHRLQELLAQGENQQTNKGQDRAQIIFGTGFPVIWTMVLLHSNFGESKSLAMVVSPGTEQQKGISMGHTSEDSVLVLREVNCFAYIQLGFFRNCSCISGERLSNSE